MCFLFVPLVLLSMAGSVRAQASTATCAPSLGCFANSDCANGGTCTGADQATFKMGCCPAANTATTVATVPTRGGGGATVCQDKLNPSTGISDCPMRTAYCTNAFYKQLMTQQCPKTCGFCTGGTGGRATTRSTISGSCVDLLNPQTGVSDCPQRRSLCTNQAYLSLMRVQCPATCGFCAGK